MMTGTSRVIIETPGDLARHQLDVGLLCALRDG
jgi:hypothetical protein